MSQSPKAGIIFERGIDDERDRGSPREVHDPLVIGNEVFGRDNKKRYREGRDDRVHEIILTEIERQFGEEGKYDKNPSDDGRIFTVGTGYEERQKSNTGDQDQILDHYRIYSRNTKKRILNGHNSSQVPGQHNGFPEAPDSPGEHYMHGTRLNLLWSRIVYRCSVLNVKPC